MPSRSRPSKRGKGGVRLAGTNDKRIADMLKRGRPTMKRVGLLSLGMRLPDGGRVTEDGRRRGAWVNSVIAWWAYVWNDEPEEKHEYARVQRQVEPRRKPLGEGLDLGMQEALV